MTSVAQRALPHMMNSMSTSNETPEAQGSPRSCWDYSPEEMRAMPDKQAGEIISQRMQDNVRKAREKARSEAAEQALGMQVSWESPFRGWGGRRFVELHTR
jgi:hypothetical protein